MSQSPESVDHNLQITPDPHADLELLFRMGREGFLSEVRKLMFRLENSIDANSNAGILALSDYLRLIYKLNLWQEILVTEITSSNPEFNQGKEELTALLIALNNLQTGSFEYGQNIEELMEEISNLSNFLDILIADHKDAIRLRLSINSLSRTATLFVCEYLMWGEDLNTQELHTASLLMLLEVMDMAASLISPKLRTPGNETEETILTWRLALTRIQKFCRQIIDELDSHHHASSSVHDLSHEASLTLAKFNYLRILSYLSIQIDLDSKSEESTNQEITRLLSEVTGRVTGLISKFYQAENYYLREHQVYKFDFANVLALAYLLHKSYPEMMGIEERAELYRQAAMGIYNQIPQDGSQQMAQILALRLRLFSPSDQKGSNHS